MPIVGVHISITHATHVEPFAAVASGKRIWSEHCCLLGASRHRRNRFQLLIALGTRRGDEFVSTAGLFDSDANFTFDANRWQDGEVPTLQ